MNVKIYQTIPQGNVNVCPSKSYCHRYLIASMLASNSSTISNVFYSDDINATLSCLKTFGCNYKINENSVTIYDSNNFTTNPIFDCHESGSTLRFFIPIALTKYDKVTFIGTKKLLSRGIEVYEKIFQEQNLKITKLDTSLIIEGKLKSGTFIIDGSLSSQYVTGLLFALSIVNGNSIIKIKEPINSKNYIYMTLDVLNKYNIKYEFNENIIKIPGNQVYQANDYTIEGDYSNAAFLEAFNYFNGQVILNGLNNNSLQGDKIYQTYFEILCRKNATLDISNCIDLGPILMVLASLKHGATFIGTNRLKIKESNRAQAIQEELKKVNVDVDILDDKVIVHKNIILKPKKAFDSHNDHRIAMALSIFLCCFNIKINHAEAIKKSYPHFFQDLEKLGVKIDYE